MGNTDKISYFFCYDFRLKEQLKEYGFRYVTMALRPKDKRRFWLFERTQELENILDKI